ncbi:hypothetical protein FB451DRAFT_1194757 [Mycena latifolia]|nr:hypothetical protein FB451DRAFT_1194757 [Mycena latifolia]
MSYYFFVQQPTWDDRAVENTITIWDRWQPTCDSCGRLESSLTEKPILCGYCLVARYCSVKCQNYDWDNGNRHKEHCHLFKVNRKLSEAFNRMQPPEGCLKERYELMSGCVGSPFLRLSCFTPGLMIRPDASTSSMAIDKKPEETPHLGIFLKLVDEGPDYDYLSFVIEKVAIIAFSHGERVPLVMTGYCVLPGATPRAPYTCSSMHHPYTWRPTHYSYNPSSTALPPGFDLDRLLLHINRGITHFHGSYWPLPFKLSDADFEAAEPPEQWFRYMRLLPHGFQLVLPRLGLGGSQVDLVRLT